MKIGIFGGTFSPIHYGHLIMASYVFEEMKLDKIIFMPAGNQPLKDNEIPFIHRLNMIKLAIEGDSRFSFTSIEDKEEPAYTYNTILEIKEKSDDELFFIMGADSLENFHKWYRYEDLLKEIEFIVLDRIGSNDLSGLKMRYEKDALGIYILRGPIIEISSTLIRNRVRLGKAIRYLVPERVCGYIEENRLYKDN